MPRSARARRRRMLGVFAASLSLVVACFGPTEVRLVLSTDVPCSVPSVAGATRLVSTRVYIGPESAGGAVASTEHCEARSTGGSELGDLVITPSGDRDAKLTVTVALAVDKDPDACFPPGSPDRCIIARRAMSFSKHRSRTVDIRLLQDCIGVVCDPSSSCYAGKCVAVELFCDDPAQCGPAIDASTPADAAVEATTTPDATTDAPLDAPFDAGPATLVVTGRTYIGSLAADASGLYWSELGGYSNANGGIYRAAPGGSPQPLATGRESPGGVSIDATTVYWLELLGEGIVRVPKSGGTSAVVLGQPGLGVNASYVLVDATHMFWNNEVVGATNGTLTRILKDGTQRATLATSTDGPWAVAQDAQSLVWVTGPRFGGAGTIFTVPKLGGSPSIVSAAETSSPTARIAAASGNVAWASTASGGSLMIRAAGKSPLTIATGQGMTTWIAADDQAVYWLHKTASGAGALEKSNWAGDVDPLHSGVQQPGSVALDASSVYFVDNRDSSELVTTAQIARLPK